MEENRLYTKQRRNEILRILREQGSISVNELSRQLQVSGTTIRLDLTDLEKTGILSRTHGGAIWNNTDHEPLIRERKNESQKNRIGKKAVSFISEHDTILIDTGTTMLSFAHALLDSECNHLIVYSNDLDVLRTLEEKEAFELHLLGGVLRNGFHYTYGNRNVVIQHLRSVEIIAGIALHLEQLKQLGRPVSETLPVQIKLHIIDNVGIIQGLEIRAHTNGSLLIDKRDALVIQQW